LNWWHEHKLSYPVLSILARDVMIVPVSILSSAIGRVIEDQRRCLDPGMVEMLAIVKDWELGDCQARGYETVHMA
jgi:hypothetical protein